MARTHTIIRQPVPPHFKQKCEGKRRYSAKGARKRARIKREHIGERIVHYRCPHCGFYHIGHPLE